MRWDIFCRVIDNFGDIGIAWRLARQLAGEHGLQVRLWLDDLVRFRLLCPEIDPAREAQTAAGVEVRRWASPFPPAAAWASVADVVIEAFACELPGSYVAAMAAKRPSPVWINLEYLSAEAWVAGCHKLASPHPRLPLTKHFFFPGFVAGSGGLLRERDLLERRDAWQARADEGWKRLRLPLPAPDELSLALFAYENPLLPEFLQAWAQGSQPCRLLLSPSKAAAQVARWLGMPALNPGEAARRGRLTVHPLPFYPQADYDLLLWLSDINFVRGEDSLVRALWAARPLVWQPYRQEAEAHLPKLAALLEIYCGALAPSLAGAVNDLWWTWNAADKAAPRPAGAASAPPPDAAWSEYLRQRAELACHAQRLAAALAELPDLAGELVGFCRSLYNRRFFSQDAP